MIYSHNNRVVRTATNSSIDITFAVLICVLLLDNRQRVVLRDEVRTRDNYRPYVQSK